MDEQPVAISDITDPSQVRVVLYASGRFLQAPVNAIGSALTAFFDALYRRKLTAARTYYVRTDGSDSNTGLANTAAGAFLTIQAAVTAAKRIDTVGFGVTISVGPGTRTASTTITAPMVGGGTLSIVGDTTTPANCVINTTSANCFNVSQGAVVDIRGFKCTTTTSGNVLNASLGSFLTYGSMDFGATAEMHINEGTECTVIATSSYTISGGAQGHFHTGGPCVLQMATITITLTGTPAFSVYFAGTAGGFQVLSPVTFSGAATGKRFLAHKNGVIDVGTTSLTFLPGNVAGTTESGGKYAGDVTNPDIIGALGATDGVMVVTNGTTGVIVKNHASGAPGTAAFVNTGTVGATVPLNNTANIFTNAQSIQYGFGAGALVLGADVNATTLTTTTRKLGRVSANPYTSGQVASFVIGSDNDGTNNIVALGGTAGASLQAATLLDFVTAAALNTAGGTSRAQMKLGLFMAGATGGDQGAGTVNATGYYVNGVKVVGARDTGWTAMTGTGSKGALAAAAAGTASASYVQAELQGALNRIAALEARLRSLDAALVTHGLIGT